MQVAGHTRAFLAGSRRAPRARADAESAIEGAFGTRETIQMQKISPAARQQRSRGWSTRRTGRFIIPVKVRAASFCLGSIVA